MSVDPELARPVTAAEARAIRQACGLSQAAFAEEIGASLATVVAIETKSLTAGRQISLAMRYVELTGPTRRARDCDACEGVGTVRETADDGRRHQHARRRPCAVCQGRGSAELERVIA